MYSELIANALVITLVVCFQFLKIYLFMCVCLCVMLIMIYGSTLKYCLIFGSASCFTSSGWLSLHADQNFAHGIVVLVGFLRLHVVRNHGINFIFAVRINNNHLIYRYRIWILFGSVVFWPCFLATCCQCKHTKRNNSINTSKIICIHHVNGFYFILSTGIV